MTTPRIISIESNDISANRQLIKQLREEYKNECDGNLYVYIGIHILNLMLLTTIFGRTASINAIIMFYVSCCISYYFYKKNHLRAGAGGEHSIVFLDPPSFSIYFDENGKNILDCYHDNVPEYAFAFYMAILYERMHQLINAIEENPNSTIVICGSIITDQNVYIEALREYGSINEVEYKVYCKWCDASCCSLPAPIYFIYINNTLREAGEFSNFCEKKYDEILSQNMPILQICCNKLQNERFSMDIIRKTIKAIRAGDDGN